MRSRSALFSIALILPLVIATACGGDDEPEDNATEDAAADPNEAVAEFYSENDLTIYEGTGQGGANDTLDRLVAEHLGKHLPGNPDILVVNNPGAGGMLNFNQLYNQLPNDGSVIGKSSRQWPLSELLGLADGVEFETQKFNWLGAFGTATVTIAVRTDVVTSFEEAQEKEVVMAASGPGSSFYDVPEVLNALAGTQFEIVPGYDGHAESSIAVERGEADGMSPTVNGLLSENREMVENGTIAPIVQVGQTADPALPDDVPLIYDFLETDEERAMMDLFTAPFENGYPFAAPPGMPEEFVAALRQGLEDTWNDPEFKQGMEDLNLTLPKFSTGDEVQERVDGIFEAPEEAVDELGKILAGDG